MMRITTAMPMVIASAVTLSLACHVALADAAGGQSSSAPGTASHPAEEPPLWNRMGVSPSVEGRLDPLIFFDELVARYRGLTSYSDSTHIIQVTRRFDDTEAHRTETRVACELTDGKLSVLTPGLQLRRGLGLELPLQRSAEMEQTRRRYDLWLLPHMALKFADKPLEELREGVPEGFTATEAASVTIDDRPMVHLELTSGDGLSGDYNARFDLYVDPESMLISRIEGRQRLPDGGDYETTYHITPSVSEGGEPVRPAANTSEPMSLPMEPAIAPTCRTAPIVECERPEQARPSERTCPRGDATGNGPLG